MTLRTSIALAAALAGLSLLATPAVAQSNEDAIAVSVEVNVTRPSAVISGLGDMLLPISAALPAGQSVSVAQPFCLFTPFRYFDMRINGSNDPVLNRYRVRDTAQADIALKELSYRVEITEQRTGTKMSLGNFVHNFFVRQIDSAPFNTDATCSSGDNLGFEIKIFGSESLTSSTTTNAEVIDRISDGQPHNYTDTLTILVQPSVN